jgi:hypothetical protein
LKWFNACIGFGEAKKSRAEILYREREKNRTRIIFVRSGAVVAVACRDDDDDHDSLIFGTTIPTKIYEQCISYQRNASKAFARQRKRQRVCRDFLKDLPRSELTSLN